MSTISGYEFTEELYKGPNSLVYRGHQKAENKLVILKMLNQAYPSPEKIARFKLEYEIIHYLNHSTGSDQTMKGVVEAYGLDTDQQQWVMMLEDFGGKSLDRLLQSRLFTLDEFLTVAIEIVEILNQVHQQHIIHKDVNPSNIVLNPTTGQLKLIDFGISTRLFQESPILRNPNVLEGTLPYMSPEQTGRMNRAVDYRTDFYSLGVTFYQLLTGQLPFSTTDPLGLVHSHIAKSPVPPHQVKPDIPQPISHIVMKLMAKNAEDRYQSALSLKADLEECLRQWQTTGRIDPFQLRQHDVTGQFQIPQKLYGREQEIDLLLAAFERVSRGASEVVMVSGYNGIGKSTLVQEVYVPITRQRGYLITGKFDQLQRDIPYASLIQAFRLLMRQVLTESEAEITAWGEKLMGALGPNGQVITQVIPEVELIIGPQPDVPDLPPAEAQNRFNLVFQNFIKVFARSEHPLIIFLDDLQWADRASLKLIEVLMAATDCEYLFLMGAYRDNEVDEAHPLRLTLDAMKEAGTAVNHISLSPLALPHIVELVADTLHCDQTQAQPLGELVMVKTEGNPFFINEFLKSLYAEQLLAFDFRGGRWQWDLAQIQARDITDNVAELMGERVQKLQKRTQQVMKLAACIGNQFDLKTLAIVYERSPQETAADLWEAMTEGLILPLDDAYKLVELNVQGLLDKVMIEYKFTHDQVQQAAYALIPEAEKQEAHCQVGQLLLHASRNSPRDLEYKIFDIVNQLNLGRELVNQQSERDELAKLNLMAGKKAKASAAYQPALNYFQIGLELLDPLAIGGNEVENRIGALSSGWTRCYDLALALHLEAAEAAYLNTDFEQMERWAEVVLQQAKTLLEKVRVYEIQIQAFMAQNKLPEAVKTGLSVLKMLGIRFPEKPTKLHILLGLIGTKLTLVGKRIEDLNNLPEMRDPIKLAAMRIFRAINAAVYLATPELFPLLVFKQVNLSIKYGNISESAQAYNMYAIILSGVVGDIDSGSRFARLALSVLTRFNAREVKAKVFFIVHFFIRPWKEPIKDTLKPLLEAYQSALETGDIEFAANITNALTTGLFFTGNDLAKVEREMTLYCETTIKLKQERALYYNQIYRQAVSNLRGHSGDPCRLMGESYDEERMLPIHLEANDVNVLSHLSGIKLLLCYLFHKYPQAVENAASLEKQLDAITGLYNIAYFHFYDALARLALFPGASKPEQKQIIKKVDVNQKKMKKWAKHAPTNFLHKFFLVEAERARVLGNDETARGYYDQAIDLARQNEYLNEEALASELAGKFYLAKGQNRVARHYLNDAGYTYRRWGALAKVQDLEERYPQFLTQEAPPASVRTSITTSTTTAGRTSSALDLTSVFKASQAISGEIVLDRLLNRLMKIVIENAGAQRGFLMLEKKGHWVIEAEGVIEQVEAEDEGEAEVTALESIPAEASDKLAAAIINYVARTKESVVLNDAAQEGLFTQDPYITRNQPKSVLCAPLINQGKLTAILYLENNLTTGAFTQDRLEVLNLLSAQAAISIENASLYSHQVELTNAASRFVPYEFLQSLKKESLVDVTLGDHVQQEMAVLFSDIRSFTTLSETMSPQENFDFVNAYFGRVSPIIRQHQGIIVKYLGDGMMAVFPKQVEDALSASIEKLKAVADFNDNRQRHGELPIRIGIGIHTGKMMLGTVGEAERMQGDFLSDVVNLTSRLEGLTKTYGASIVISQEVLNRLKDPTQYNLRFLGKVQVKGRHEPVSVFEVLDGEPEHMVNNRLQTKAEFEQGLIFFYDRKFNEAKAHLEQVLKQNPEDEAARRYLRRAIHFMEHGVPQDWTGFEALTEK